MSTTSTVVRDPKTGRFQRSEDAQAKALEDQALKKALGAVAKAFLTGNAAVMQPASTGGPQKPGTSWSNQGGTSSALIARVTQNLAQSFGRAPEDLELALAEQGLSWGPPFPPGRPLDPFWGYRRPPRMWDFAVGENVQLTPRWDRTSFQTIKAVYDAYDVAQIVVRHLINDVRSLKYSFVAPEGVTEDVSADIEQVREFFKMPDKRQPFRQWLAEWLQDVLRYDAGSLYIRRNEAGEPIALEVVDGTTLIPLIDFYGRVAADEDDNDATPGDDLFPANVTPAFLQIIEGLPWVWLTSDDILYQPWNPLPNSQYGLSPLESVLISANTDLRFQWHFLQYFTEGSLPAGFMEAPPDQSDPDSLAEWQETWDAIMLGDQAQLRQIRFVPSGSKFTPAKNSDFDDKFPLYLMRRVCAAYGVTPNDLGFTENVNRATGDTQVDVQFRVGIVPLLRYVEDVINLFIAQHLNLRTCISIDDGREVEDRLVTAQANQIYINTGVKSGDEVRAELGLPIDKARPMPRYIMSPKGGTAQPVITLDAAAGKVDPETYGPDPSQKEPPKPPEPPTPPGMIAQGSPPNEPDGSPVEPPGNPGPDDEDAVKSAYQVIDALLDRLGVSKDGSGPGVTGGTMSTGGPLDIGAPDNTGGPGVTRGFSNASTITGGISVDTDIQGVDLLGPKVKEDDDEDDEDAAKALLIRQWRENAKNRLRKGLRPRRFDDAPSELQDAIWAKLESASSMEEVDRAFKETTPNPKGRPGPWGHLEQELTDYWEGPIALAVAAGIVPLAVATAWLHQREALAGMSQTPEAFAEALSLNDEPLKRTLTDLYSDSWLPGAKDAVSQVAHKPDLAGTQAVDAVDWPKWTPGDVPSQESLQGTGFESMLAQVDTWLSEIDATTKRQIAQALQDGIDEGLGAKQVGQKIDAVLHDPKRAQVIARTEVNRCMSQASIETYKQHGIAQWDLVTAMDPCPKCLAIKAGNPHSVADVGEMPPEHPNCLPGSVRVVVPGDVEARLALDPLAGGAISVGGTASAPATAIAERHIVRGMARAATEREFVGDLVVVKTALGHELSATPNHPIATSGGWLPISALREGDHVLSSTSSEWVVDAVHPDVEDIPPTIQEIAESFPMALAPMPTSAEDFHGDGADGEVYVVRTDGLLGFAYTALCEQHLLEKSLGGGDIAAEPLDGERVGALGLEGTDAASHGGMGGVREPLPFLGSGMGHAGDHPGTPVPGGDAMRQQDSPDSTTADSEGFCERLLALSPEIAADQVVSVKRVPFRGHVYNLETPNGWYIGNGIVTHNCRCTPAPVVMSGGA